MSHFTEFQQDVIAILLGGVLFVYLLRVLWWVEQVGKSVYESLHDWMDEKDWRN